MENFKKVLKFSIERKADYVWLIENERATSCVDSVESVIDVFPEISREELSQVLKALLPAATSLEKGESKTGFFPVVGVGDLQISASMGNRLCVGLILSANDSSMSDIIAKKHQENTFVAGGLEVPPPAPVDPINADLDKVLIPQATEAAISDDLVVDTPDVPANDGMSIDIPDVPANDGLSIDIPDVPANDGLSIDSPSLSADIPDLAADIPNLGADINEHTLSIDTSGFVEDPPSAAEPSEDGLAIDMDMLGGDSDQIELNDGLSIDMNADFSADPVTNVMNSGVAQEDSFVTSADMFPASSELQYTDSYDVSSASQQESKTLHFGPTLPGETVGGAGAQQMDALLRMMIERGASDIHLTQGEEVCLRIDGDIERIAGEVLDASRMETLVLPILPEKNKKELIETNDTDFSYAIEGVARFRVNLFRDLRGIGCVIRQIPNEVLTVEQLNLPEAIVNLCKLGKGLVVVTGPTGSGKSTTLAAMVDYINRNRKTHILTIEDPVEFVHKPQKSLINQREVYKHTGSFSRALKAALREDPDIVLIGEMRDLETVAIAIETAETGHLVFGTLHTNTAISTIDRLIDQFPSDGQEQIRVMLSDSLKGVVAQTLLKKKGGGRVAAHEVLIGDKAVGAQIREKNTHMLVSHMQTQKKQGNILLNDSLIKLVETGVVDVDEAYAKAVDKDSFASLLKMKKIAFKE